MIYKYFYILFFMYRLIHIPRMSKKYITLHRIENGLPVITHHVTVVRPTSEFHETSLFVEGEVFNVDFAKRFIDGRRFPDHFSRMVQDRFGHDCYLVVSVGTEKEQVGKGLV